RTSRSLAPSATPFASYAAHAPEAARSMTEKDQLALRIDFPAAKAPPLMVVHHADGLHEGVHDSRSDEAEAAAPEIRRKRVGDRVPGRHIGPPATARAARLAVHEAPDIAREAAVLPPDRQERPRIEDGRVDLGAVADDAGIGEQAPLLGHAIARDLLEVEAVESGAVVLALGEDRVP